MTGKNALKKPSPGEVRELYVLGMLGGGFTSKVFHAIDHTGAECAIKMYSSMWHGIMKPGMNGSQQRTLKRKQMRP